MDKLSDVKLRNLAEPGKHFDGGGLYLEVTPAGGRYWRLKYRFAGKEKRLAFGVYVGADPILTHPADPILTRGCPRARRAWQHAPCGPAMRHTQDSCRARFVQHRR